MRITAPRQPDDERRAPITPAVAKRLVGLGAQVIVESGLGQGAHATDDDYRAAGAQVVPSETETTPAIWSDTDVLVTLAPPTEAQAQVMTDGTLLVGMLAPLAHPELIGRLADQGVTAMAMEFLPRISRAQAMDVLSSQANIGGYKAVLLGAAHCGKMFPMMITAAGTLSPAKVFIIGIGVAGLQAIATAKRLGAVVEAYDVRPATKEQAQSLGARFVELKGSGGGETDGGYAKEQTKEERQQQTELMAKHVIGADVVITTAAVFGKAPPMLIPADLVARMSPGSVIVDLAASPDHDRGNCELTRPGQVTTTGGVTLDGTLNLPGTVPTHASQAYANNIYSLLTELITPASKDDDDQDTPAKLTLNLDDPVQASACITHGGAVVDDRVRQALPHPTP